MTNLDTADDKRDGPEGYKDEQTLWDMYYGQGMSTVEIGEHFNKDSSTIHYHMEKCGIERRSVSESKYAKSKRISNHQELTEEVMRRLYIEKQMTEREIARRVGCSRDKIQNRLEKFGFERRSMGEARALRELRKPLTLKMNNGYRNCRTHHKGVQYNVRIHRLAAVAWFGWDAVVGKVVHHKNSHKLDNREENLEPMTNSAHTKHHVAAGDLEPPP